MVLQTVSNLSINNLLNNEFYLLLHTTNQSAEISFLQPNHPSQKPIFQSVFNGKGVYLMIEVENVDKVYKQLKEKGVQIEIRDEPWGDRQFYFKKVNVLPFLTLSATLEWLTLTEKASTMVSAWPLLNLVQYLTNF